MKRFFIDWLCGVGLGLLGLFSLEYLTYKGIVHFTSIESLVMVFLSMAFSMSLLYYTLFKFLKNNKTKQFTDENFVFSIIAFSFGFLTGSLIVFFGIFAYYPKDINWMDAML